MKQLLIVAHAPSPNTLCLRNAAEHGARHPDIKAVSVVVKAPLDAGPEDIRTCDAILLGTTENLGYMSGALKDFFDRSYYPVLEERLRRVKVHRREVCRLSLTARVRCLWRQAAGR